VRNGALTRKNVFTLNLRIFEYKSKSLCMQLSVYDSNTHALAYFDWRLCSE